MMDIVTTLRQLSSRHADNLSDYARINAFVEAAHTAADEIERLRRVVEQLSTVARKDGDVEGKLWADNEGPHGDGRRMEAVPAMAERPHHSRDRETRRATTKKRQRG